MSQPPPSRDETRTDEPAAVAMTEARASEILQRALDEIARDVFANAARPEPGDDDVVLLLRRRTPLSIDVAEPGASAHELVVLSDGSALIRTTWSVTARDELALVLAEWHAEWHAEHDDPRGVPSFVAARLGSARAAASYDDALARIGEEIAFIVPRSLSESGVAKLPLGRILGLLSGDE